MAVKGFSCRIYGVLVDGSKVLLTRSRFMEREFVNFPGGGVELGESPLAALKREFHEETGLEIEPVRVLYASEGLHLSTQQPFQIVSIYWLVNSRGGDLKHNGNGDDVVSLFWSELDEVPTSEMFPSDREFAANLLKVLSSERL
jgi:8-oxo-dGTP diphosphatase